MNRARAGHGRLRPALPFLSMVAAMAIVAACVSSPPTGTATTRPDASATGGTPTDSGAPTASGGDEPSPSDVAETSTPGTATSSPDSAGVDCTGSDDNRAFFQQAAASLGWPVYCAVLEDGWFLEDGHYVLANGGQLDLTYLGPADAHIAIVEGNICGGDDVDSCAPRDAVIGPASFGDRDAELGRLANGLVLDLDRGSTPSWRATGLGLSEDAFRQIGAALVVVDD